MPPARGGGPARAAGAAVIGLAVWATVLRTFWFSAYRALEALAASGPDSPVDLLVLGAAGVGALLTTWLGLAATVCALAALPGATGRAAAGVATWLAPAVVRRTVAVLLGGGLVAGTPMSAHAGPPLPEPTVATAAQASSVPAPDPGFAITTPAPARLGTPTLLPPERPEGPERSQPSQPSQPPSPEPAATPAAGPAPHPAVGLGPLGPAARPAPAAHRVTVVPGDTLWLIAARHLGPGATDRQVALEWPRWYAANRAVIGSDPDVILPGQQLAAPTQQGGAS